LRVTEGITFPFLFDLKGVEGKVDRKVLYKGFEQIQNSRMKNYLNIEVKERLSYIFDIEKTSNG
jgi:hypothetical protein